MFEPSRIQTLIESKSISKKEFCKIIGITVQTLDNTMKGAEIGSRKLERIADYFKVPIDYFYNREIDINHPDNSIGHHVNGNGNKISGDISISEYKKEIIHLKEIIKEKQTIIEEKERTIQILLNK